MKARLKLQRKPDLLPRVSNGMVRANLNLMSSPAKKILSNYARRNNITLEEATRRTLAVVREFERLSSMEIEKGSASFTPFVTFIGVRQPIEPIFERAVSHAEHGRIPMLPKIPKFKIKNLRKEFEKEHTKDAAKYKRFKTIQEHVAHLAKGEKMLYRKPITKFEVIKNRLLPMESGTYKYCTAYSNRCLKEVIKLMDKKKASPEVLTAITHEMHEILNPHISAETALHLGTTEEEKRIAHEVYKKLQRRLK